MMHIVTAVPLAEIISVDLFGKRLAPGSGAAFIVLVAFLVSYLAIRTSARMTRERVLVAGRRRVRGRPPTTTSCGGSC